MEKIIPEEEGNITISEIRYAGEIISFKKGQELLIQYCKFFDNNIIYIDYDFGMTDETTITLRFNGYLGIHKNSTIKEIVERVVTFDVEHAFCHPVEDPNYEDIHWAICGWLKDRVVITEDYEFFLKNV